LSRCLYFEQHWYWVLIPLRY
jgi:hypothetical protein